MRFDRGQAVPRLGDRAFVIDAGLGFSTEDLDQVGRERRADLRHLPHGFITRVQRDGERADHSELARARLEEVQRLVTRATKKKISIIKILG